MVYWKISWFAHIFLPNYHMLTKVYALSRSYLEVLGYCFPIFMPNPCTGGINANTKKIQSFHLTVLLLSHFPCIFFVDFGDVIFKYVYSILIINLNSIVVFNGKTIGRLA